MPKSAQTITLVLAAGWQTVPLGNFGPGVRVGEVYVTSAAGATLEVLAVGAIDEFDDATLPQLCGYYATDIAVAASAVGPGFLDIVTDGGVVATGQTTGSLGIKSAGIATVTFTIKGD